MAIALFALGIPAGGLLAEGFALIASAHPELVAYIFLVGPFCCVLVGIVLAVPAEIGQGLLLPAAPVQGAALGLVIDFSHLAKWPFAAGAVLAGVWIAIAVLLTWRAFEQQWLVAASRILGSWLIAIGALLFAARLIPQT
jgi:hypothetical protein